MDGRAGDGQTALFIAASEGYPRLAQALLDANADPDLPNSQTSFTPLHSVRRPPPLFAQPSHWALAFSSSMRAV